ncbi:MAG TPA: hypothetical protein VM537_12160 [Anaerolineae bacterium]|nr:hypothetical protein [Anaerolineae bacterium]
MKITRWLAVIAVLVGLLVTTRFASPATPRLFNDLPLGRCYSRCAASILLDFDWCASGCRYVLGGGEG